MSLIRTSAERFGVECMLRHEGQNMLKHRLLSAVVS